MFYSFSLRRGSQPTSLDDSTSNGVLCATLPQTTRKRIVSGPTADHERGLSVTDGFDAYDLGRSAACGDIYKQTAHSMVTQPQEVGIGDRRGVLYLRYDKRHQRKLILIGQNETNGGE